METPLLTENQPPVEIPVPRENQILDQESVGNIISAESHPKADNRPPKDEHVLMETGSSEESTISATNLPTQDLPERNTAIECQPQTKRIGVKISQSPAESETAIGNHSLAERISAARSPPSTESQLVIGPQDFAERQLSAMNNLLFDNEMKNEKADKGPVITAIQPRVESDIPSENQLKRDGTVSTVNQQHSNNQCPDFTGLVVPRSQLVDGSQLPTKSYALTKKRLVSEVELPKESYWPAADPYAFDDEQQTKSQNPKVRKLLPESQMPDNISISAEKELMAENLVSEDQLPEEHFIPGDNVPTNSTLSKVKKPSIESNNAESGKLADERLQDGGRTASQQVLLPMTSQCPRDKALPTLRPSPQGGRCYATCSWNAEIT